MRGRASNQLVMATAAVMSAAVLSVRAADVAGAGPVQSSSTQSAICQPGGGRAKASATFVNASAATVTVYWVDYSCAEREYHVLAAGAQYVQPTFVGQLWRVRDLAGNLVGEVKIKAGRSGVSRPTVTIR